MPSMTKASLTNAEWAAVKPLLAAAGSQGLNDRRVVAGIRWVHKTGRGWRNIPGVVGSGWTTFYNRYVAWKRSGLWGKLQRAIDRASAKPTAAKTTTPKTAAKATPRKAVRPARRARPARVQTAKPARKTARKSIAA